MDCIRHIEEECREVLNQSEIRTVDLIRLLNGIKLTAQDVHKLMEIDLAKPYGRKLLFNHSRLEVMVATWTRGFPCVPHDHSSSRSAIRVLQGRAHHRLFRIEENQLIEKSSESKSLNEIIRCSPLQVHAMGDDAAEQSLVTLHAYSGKIDNMIIYAQGSSMLVSGQCGAWVPDNSSHILDSIDTIVSRAEWHGDRAV